MIESEELAAWAELYDLGFQNLDLTSEPARLARQKLSRLVRERYAALFPGRSVPFEQFNSEVIRKIKAFLKRNQ